MEQAISPLTIFWEEKDTTILTLAPTNISATLRGGAVDFYLETNYKYLISYKDNYECRYDKTVPYLLPEHNAV
ncbi:MAG: hypothetical protein WC045_00880 [Patescibacteria group bacterium]